MSRPRPASLVKRDHCPRSPARDHYGRRGLSSRSPQSASWPWTSHPPAD